MSTMNGGLLLWVAMCAGSATAVSAAAPPGPSAEGVRQRVVEELLRDGVSVARLGRELVLEPVAAGVWRLRVENAATGQVVARKELGGVPAELEAAVAQIVIAARPMLAMADPTDPWRQTFSPEAVGSHLRGKDLKIAVLAAGDRLDDARAAVAAIEAALRASPRCKLVLDASSMGTAGLDDPAILVKADRLPADQTFVVRAFADGDVVSAVVTMYDRAREVVGAFTAARGEALPRGVSGDERSDGLAEAVTLVGQKSRERKKAEDEYEARAVGFRGLIGVSTTGTHTVVTRWTEPYKGKYQEPLEGARFYEYVGRADLARRYLEKDRLRKGLMVGAGVVAGGGVALALSGFVGLMGDDCELGPDFDPCLDRQTARVTRIIIGTGIGIAGSGMIIAAGLLVKRHPVSASEARRLGDEYNQKLRRDLGLDDEHADAAPAATPSDTREPAFTLAAAPWVTPGGGGLVLTLGF